MVVRDQAFRHPEWGMVCHLIADDLEELHRAAMRLGLKRQWFQPDCRNPHYDLMRSRIAAADLQGIPVVSREEFFEVAARCRQSIAAAKEAQGGPDRVSV